MGDAVATVVQELVKIGPWGLLVAVLVLIIVALVTGYLVPGKDRDEWKRLAKDDGERFDRYADYLEGRRHRREPPR